MFNRAGAPETYIELHARSAFSFLEGASLPETLATQAAEWEMPALAVLDRDSVSGAVRFHNEASKLGIRALIGAEVTATEGFRYPLLAETRQGYQSLCRLLSKIKLREECGNQHKAAATWEDVAEHAAGLVCLTGGDEGPLEWALRSGDESARAQVERLTGIFGTGNVYAELQRHHLREEERRNQAAMALSRRFQLPLLASNGVSFAAPPDRELMDVLACIRHKTNIHTAGRLLARNSERSFKRGSVMSRLFADIPEAIANTGQLASRLAFTLADLGYRFPAYPTPEGHTMDSFLRFLAYAGMSTRYGGYPPAVREQIEKELALIAHLELAGYFLIVWDIVRFCRDRNILAQGRGSAANSALCYALGITAVDPQKFELLFERFLSENRDEWPDIDIDLPSGDQRERAIQYVYERYGRLGAAMTANVITYRGRSAAREVGKALGFDEERTAALAKLAPEWGYTDANDAAELRFRQAGFDLHRPEVQKFFGLFQAIQDLPRHLGQHSGGMVICAGSLDRIVPLQPATMPGRVVVQWDKDDCADMKIIKIDLLGLGMMAVLEETIQLIRRHRAEEVDLANLPAGDPAVYSALQAADTIGLFQVESRAQMSCLPRLKPVNFYDIVVEVAIIRPGPIVGEMYHPYLRRRQKREAPDAPHPLLEPVLRRTLGVPLFQEQLLRMAMIAASFSGGEAEELRRAFGHKRSERKMRAVEVKLRAGMTANGITGEAQDRIIQSITSFAAYGFPESHAASFALIAYASAYLKCHYLDAFTAAILNNQPMGFYSPAVLVKDAQRHGLRVLPVDVTRSEWLCSIENGSVRLGLKYAKGLRQEAAEVLLSARAERAFSSIDDLATRTGLRRPEINRLAEIGALNSLGGIHRRDALWQAQRASLPAGPLLERLEEAEQTSPLQAMAAEERLWADYEGTGLTIGRHPMAYRREEMDALGVTRAIDVPRLPNGRLVRIAGAIIVRQRPGTAKGFVFLTLEDETGITNAVLTPDFFQHNKLPVLESGFLLVEGELQNQDGVVSVKAEYVEGLRHGAVAASHDFH
jgi:error-prone DNA polymerase